MTITPIPEIALFADDMTRWRHHLHRHPELAFEEFDTSEFCAQLLTSFGLDVRRGLGKTGVVAIINGLEDGPMIGLRADMDALPMNEETGLRYQSTHQGKFHGCGHDGHTAMLLGAARYLSQNRPKKGKVCLIFQPAEENIAGARQMMADGLFKQYPCTELFAFHTMPTLRPGTAMVLSGPTMIGSTIFEVEVTGKGGHGGAPHLSQDPLQVAARITSDIPSIIGRNIDPLASGVITVGRLHSGSVCNVIPETAELSGTIRCYELEIGELIKARLEAMCHGYAEMSGCKVTVSYPNSCPPCINHKTSSLTAERAAAAVLGETSILTGLDPLPFGDDFAWMLREIGGAYIFLGQSGPMLHNQAFDFDDALLPIGASIFCHLANSSSHDIRSQSTGD